MPAEPPYTDDPMPSHETEEVANDETLPLWEGRMATAPRLAGEEATQRVTEPELAAQRATTACVGTGTRRPIEAGLMQHRFRGMGEAGQGFDMRCGQRAITLEGEQSRYLVHTVLGHGGQGVVFSVQDQDFGREIAVKTMRGDRLKAGQIARFVHEAQITAQIEHPGVVPIYDMNVLPDGTLYYSMKRISGQTLHDWSRGRRKRGTFSRFEALQYFVRVCQTIHFAHTRGVIHRDLKPSNIMIGDFGEVLVLDWGLSKVMGQADIVSLRTEGLKHEKRRQGSSAYETLAGHAVGTPNYMSPEQACGHSDRIGPATDIFSLGVILYELLCGHAPYPSLEAEEVIQLVAEERWRPLTRWGDGIPEPLIAIVRRAMAGQPAQRYPDAASLAADVNAWLSGRAVAAYNEPFGEALLRACRRHRETVRSVAVIVVLLIIGLGAWYWWSTTQARQELERWHQQAAVASLAGDHDQARQLYERIVGRQPADTIAQRALFDDLRRREKQAEALEQARGREASIDTARRLLAEARQLMAALGGSDETRLSDLERVRDRLNRAIASVPESEQELAQEILDLFGRVSSAISQAIEAEFAASTRARYAEQIAQLRSRAEREEAQGDYVAALDDIRAAQHLARDLDDHQISEQLTQQRDRLRDSQRRTVEWAAEAADEAAMQALIERCRRAIEAGDTDAAGAHLARLREMPRAAGRLEVLSERLATLARHQRHQQADDLIAEAGALFAGLLQTQTSITTGRRLLRERERLRESGVVASDPAADFQLEQEVEEQVQTRAAHEARLISLLHQARLLAEDHAPVRALLARYYAWLVQESSRRGDRATATAIAAIGRIYDDAQTHRLLFDGQALIRNTSDTETIDIVPLDEDPARIFRRGSGHWQLSGGQELALDAGRYLVFNQDEVLQALLVERGASLAISLPRGIRPPPGSVFVPGGEYIDRAGERQQVSGVIMTRCEITCGAYQGFLQDLARTRDEGARYRYPRNPDGEPLWARRSSHHFVLRWRNGATIDPQLPVVGISIDDARAFARWRSRRDGLPWRLPRAAEWHLAAQGGDGRRYPWGDYAQLAYCYGLASHDSTSGVPVHPVASFPVDRSVQGVHDLAGSVSEFVSGSWPALAGFALHCGGNFGDRRAERFTTDAERAIDERLVSPVIGFRLALDPAALSAD